MTAREPIRLAWATCTLDLAEPFVIARANVSQVTTFFVRLRLDGVSGYGEARPAGYLGETAEQVGRELAGLADALRTGALPGFGPADLPRAHALLRGLGTSRAVRTGVDAALHDLQGRRTGRPAYKLLGLGRGNLTTMRTVSLGDPEQMARSAAALPGRGPAKLKLGGRDGRDADRLRAVRAATQRRLAVDANGAWSYDEALDLLPVLTASRVVLVEQPLAPGDPAGAKLKAACTAAPLILDEECLDIADLDRCARYGHGVNIKLGKSGGLLPAVRLARAARDRGLRVMVGCHLESSLGISAASQLTGLATYADLDGNLLLASDPWQGPAGRRGRQRPPRAPGLGVRPRPGYRPSWVT